jgi:hypothetical protein
VPDRVALISWAGQGMGAAALDINGGDLVV